LLVPADISAHDFVADPSQGSEVAERLSLTIRESLKSGSAGTAHLLADGRVLKVTWSKSEAIRAFLLMRAQDPGQPCPGFPRIDRVVRMSSGVDVENTLYALDAFAIVREEAADLDNDWPGGNDHPHWMMALGLLGEARRDGRPGVPDLGPAEHCAPHLEAVYDAIVWAAAELGFAVDDVRTSNFGVASGRVVIRDFGGDNVLDDAPGILTAIERIPSLPATRPSP
jgi:hypothetical protein